jgi:hypothetical protein
MLLAQGDHGYYAPQLAALQPEDWQNMQVNSGQPHALAAAC